MPRSLIPRVQPGAALRCALPMILLAIALVVPATAQKTFTASRAKTFEVWVYADAGDDANPGTKNKPLQTLNRALQLAWNARHPTVGKGVKHGRILVVHSSTPIAPGPTPGTPKGFGGLEQLNQGWLTTNERRAGCVRQPFPIRMVDGIDVIGIQRNGRKPVITIDELTAGVMFRTWTPVSPCNPVKIQAAVLPASRARLHGFVIDGRRIDDTSKSRFPGIRVMDVHDAKVSDCEIYGWHDQVDVDPGSANATASVTFRNCIMSDAWPINLGSVGADFGHAAMWIRGPGDCTVTLDGCTFARSHDALEIAVSNSRADVTVKNCLIVDNENGLEVVGDGLVTLRIEDCEFIDNYNRAAGGTPPSSGLVAAAAFRGNLLVDCSVRRSVFRNNTVGFLWQVEHPSILDLGASEQDPGLNSFCLDYCVFPAGEDVYATCIVQRNTTTLGQPGTIMAIGNAWLPNNQGSTGPLGRQMTGQRNGIIEPAVAFDGMGCDNAGIQHPRQYSSNHTGALIVFDPVGMSPPVFAEPCLDCQAAGCP